MYLPPRGNVTNVQGKVIKVCYEKLKPLRDLQEYTSIPPWTSWWSLQQSSSSTKSSASYRSSLRRESRRASSLLPAAIPLTEAANASTSSTAYLSFSMSSASPTWRSHASSLSSRRFARMVCASHSTAPSTSVASTASIIRSRSKEQCSGNGGIERQVVWGSRAGKASRANNIQWRGKVGGIGMRVGEWECGTAFKQHGK